MCIQGWARAFWIGELSEKEWRLLMCFGWGYLFISLKKKFRVFGSCGKVGQQIRNSQRMLKEKKLKSGWSLWGELSSKELPRLWQALGSTPSTI